MAPRACVLLSGAVAALLAFSGCAAVDDFGETTSSPRPAAKSGFATDAEALAAANEAYQRYLEVLDQVSASDADVERLRDVAAPAYADEVIGSVESLKADGLRIDGKSAFDGMRVFERWSEGDVEFVSTYLCFDSTGVRVIDSSGADVTPSDRVDRRSVVVRFQSSDTERLRLVPRSSDTWLRDEFCG